LAAEGASVTPLAQWVSAGEKERYMPNHDRDSLLKLCRTFPGVTEDVKWGNDLVFSVGGKMFAVFELPDFESVGLKVEPALFPILTQRTGVIPAPYLAHHSWIRITSLAALPPSELEMLLREAYGLVARKLPKKTRVTLGIEV
jgi:predicted DNA-binding protein (MmcQ/YjbR family)